MSLSLPPLEPNRHWLLGCAIPANKNPIEFFNNCAAKHGPVFRVNLAGQEYVIVAANHNNSQLGSAARSLAAEFFDHNNQSLSLRHAGLRVMRFDTYLPQVRSVHLHSDLPTLVRNAFPQKGMPKHQADILSAAKTAITAQIGDSAVINDVASFALNIVAAMSATAFLDNGVASDPRVLEFFKTFFIYTETVQSLTTIFPPWLVNIIVWFMFSLHASIRKFNSIILPKIKRKRQQDSSNDSREVKNTLFQSLIESEPDNEKAITQIILLIVATMRNTSIALINILYDIASHENLANDLRDEFITAIESEFLEFKSMPLLDSFIRESLYQAAKPISSVRCTVSDTILGGFLIPKDSLILLFTPNVHGNAHWTEQMIGNAARKKQEFNAARWVSTNKLASTSSNDYLLFGGGKFGCPGRHLGILELKCQPYLTYDLALGSHVTASSTFTASPCTVFSCGANQVISNVPNSEIDASQWVSNPAPCDPDWTSSLTGDIVPVGRLNASLTLDWSAIYGTQLMSEVRFRYGNMASNPSAVILVIFSQTAMNTDPIVIPSVNGRDFYTFTFEVPVTASGIQLTCYSGGMDRTGTPPDPIVHRNGTEIAPGVLAAMIVTPILGVLACVGVGMFWLITKKRRENLLSRNSLFHDINLRRWQQRGEERAVQLVDGEEEELEGGETEGGNIRVREAADEFAKTVSAQPPPYLATHSSTPFE
ncbi:hypothetical protein HK100_003696 [Physocladia obscura]|uniref:Cytochrome P450 n=1 Tax=Physocladia obscura TaxID=109957 RepID=A0AAD5XDE5_9FUNG|nr:hypothetical protein HK100_003696 [Physocladia obscura]